MTDWQNSSPAQPAKVCAAGPCQMPRVGDSVFCGQHGPKGTVSKGRQSGGRVTRPQMVCPHCQATGTVSTRQVKRKQGISGAKATGAVLTAGFSLFATGLSRKQQMTEAQCSNCGSTWSFG